MPIRVVCSSCQGGFKFADADAGRSGKCPRCKQPLTIPHVARPRTR